MISRFVANSEKCRKYTFLGGSAQIITILHRGGYRNLLQYYMGGVFPIYYNITMGGGSLGTPNLYYVIYERPLIRFDILQTNSGELKEQQQKLKT